VLRAVPMPAAEQQLLRLALGLPPADELPRQEQQQQPVEHTLLEPEPESKVAAPPTHETVILEPEPGMELLPPPPPPPPPRAGAADDDKQGGRQEPAALLTTDSFVLVPSEDGKRGVSICRRPVLTEILPTSRLFLSSRK
jgi:hypothetical protein